ncbi:MAG: type II toxin-antitoxin system YhaV family toxin [Candidatus Acidiferrum sp.]
MAKPRKKHRKAQPSGQKPVTAPSALYAVEMVPSAEAVYKKLYQNMKDAEARGEASSSHHTTFRMVEEAIKTIIPRNPIDRSFGLSGPLSKYFRIKKGRMRICWAANSATKKVTILFISETMRKEGDANDPYNIFTKLVMSGEFQKFVGPSWGIPPPPRSFAASAGAHQVQ